ncbi:MAG TPA: PEGA domain-containing protein [Vicinamibacterales bacterium]|nr:PEGA domain-containing protein [Vicinamibacterales bacterium]
MKKNLVTTLAVAFAISGLTAASAQDRTSNGNTTGSAVPRGDGGGSAVSRGGGGDSGGASSSSSSGSSGSSSGWTSPTPGAGTGTESSTPSTWSAFEAPRRSNEQPQGRSRGGGSSTGDRAVPRGGSGDSRGGDPRGSGGTAATASTGSSGEAPSRRAVPTYSRPRDGKPVTGMAVDRGSVPPSPGGGGSIIYYPYYPWGFWGPGYSYGLGYLFYDPWYGGGYGYGYPYGGYGYGGYGYGGYGYGGGSGGYRVSQPSKETGKLRLKIDPKQAEVYVDGYYVGTIDNFDGSFQKLELDAGSHRIDLKANGFESLQFEVLIPPGETVTYKGDMKRIQ